MAKDHYIMRIASEAGDIVLNPLKCGDLVEERVVSRGMMLRFACQFRMRQKAEDIHTIVEVHKYHALLGEVSAVILILRRCTAHIAAAVDEYHNRQMRIRGLGWSPDIHKEAVFAERTQPLSPGVAFCGGWRLHACGAEMIRSFHASPRCDRLWRAPAKIAYRRDCIRNAAIESHAGSPLDCWRARHRASGDLDWFF